MGRRNKRPPLCKPRFGIYADSACARKFGIRRVTDDEPTPSTPADAPDAQEGLQLTPLSSVRATTLVSVTQMRDPEAPALSKRGVGTGQRRDNDDALSNAYTSKAVVAKPVGGIKQVVNGGKTTGNAAATASFPPPTSEPTDEELQGRHRIRPPTAEEVAVSFRGSFSPCAITIVTLFGNFLTVLDQSILDVSIVAIAEDLGSDLTTTQWIITAYYLANCGFLPVAGRLGDRFSKTRVYLLGLIVFGVTSLACAQATSLPMLIAFRCIQGIGASFIMGNKMAMVTHFTTLKNRGTAIGYNVVTVGIALSAGPVIGGIVTEYAGWRALFYINVPICIGGIILLCLLVPDTPFRASSIDWVGSGLILLTVGALIFSVNQLDSDFARASPVVFSGAAFGSFSFLLLATGLWHRCAAAPLLPRFLLGSKAAMMSIGNQFFVFFSVALLRFTLPTYLQLGLSLSPSETGLAMLAQPIAMIVAGPIAGCLSKRFEARVLATVGTLIFACGLVAFGFALENLWVLIAVTFVGSCGIPVFNVPNARFILSSMVPAYLGIAGGFLQMIRSMALPLGIATANLLVQTFYASMTGGQNVEEVETGNLTCSDFELSNVTTLPPVGLSLTTLSVEDAAAAAAAAANSSEPCLDADVYLLATQYTAFVIAGVSFAGAAFSALRGALVVGHVGKEKAAELSSDGEEPDPTAVEMEMEME